MGARDALTGLLTPDAARDRLAAWAAQDDRPPLMAMLIGLRRFQTVNLAYGEEAGDHALARTARIMAHFAGEELDSPWFAARLGGRDFLLVCEGRIAQPRWQWLAEELADQISRPVPIANGTMRLTVRVALLEAGAQESGEGVLGRLGEALNAAHRRTAGRSLWADSETHHKARSSNALESDLMRAPDRGEIEVVLQPQFAVASGHLVGAEVLARWNHAELGRIGAGTLFSVAERADFTEHLSRHIAHLALSAAAAWPAALADLRLSLNLTANDLASSGLRAFLTETLQSTGFAASRLTLEITEQALIADLDGSAQLLEHLQGLGIRFAIDDFGTGYSNFLYLKALPLHYLKLDHVMTKDIASGPRDQVIVRAIIGMAKALGLEVIAEGVETERQRALLAEEGCDYFQGFLRGKAMSASEFEQFALRSD